MYIKSSRFFSYLLVLSSACAILFLNFQVRENCLKGFDFQGALKAENLSFRVINRPKVDKFYKSELILELQGEGFFVPKRLLAKVDSSLGYEYGDLLRLVSLSPEIRDLSGFRARIYRKDRVYKELRRAQFEYLMNKAGFIYALQNKIKNFYYENLGSHRGSIVSSILLGSRVESPPKDFIQKARSLGLGHFFAASGFHLLVVYLFLVWLLNLFACSKVLKLALALPLILGYSALAGFSPSIVRAACFLIAHLILNYKNRKLRAFNFLFLIAFVNLLINPYDALDLGFQFSYVAVFAILVWAPIFKKRLYLLPNYLQDLLSISISVQVFLLPLIAYYFHDLQIFSVFANLIFAPFLSLLLLLSLTGLYFLINPLLWLIVWAMNLFTALPLVGLDINLSLVQVLLLFMALNLAAILINYDFLDFSFKERSLDKPFCLSLLASVSMIFASTSLPITAFGPWEPLALDTSDPRVLRLENLDSIQSIGKLREANVLVLPHMGSKDIYLDTILKVVKPDLVLYDFKQNSKRLEENMDLTSSCRYFRLPRKLYFNAQKEQLILGDPC